MARIASALSACRFAFDAGSEGVFDRDTGKAAARR
ncbi:hypothetical protein D512_29373 [Burkholderia pseudomallei MSHR1043]|nr:hypothetical protein BPC006_II2842 [Burkholderia pseudomallei BPC006]EMP74084.1 hypothetical protein D512_29373 [Burkholderia pseudomallei MSHR1043]